MTESPILIVGLPRSGTTWIGEVLTSAPGVRYLFEPDNEGISPLAWYCKKKLHRFPYLMPSDESNEYFRLWRAVFHGKDRTWFLNNLMGLLFRKKAPELEAYIGDKSGFVYLDKRMHRVVEGRINAYRVDDHPLNAYFIRQILSHGFVSQQRSNFVVKSVHAVLSVGWICNYFPIKVVFVLRNPYSLYASYKRMKLPDGFRSLFNQETLQRDLHCFFPEEENILPKSQEENIAFQIMLMYKIIEQHLIQNPEWFFVSHDRLCILPHDGFQQIFDKLNFDWSHKTITKINASNENGVGFYPKRVTNQQPFRWKSELNFMEQKMISRLIDVFNLKSFFREKVDIE